MSLESRCIKGNGELFAKNKQIWGGMEEFAQFLKETRKRLNMTQAQAYEGICSRREYQRYESNENEPGLYILRQLSSRFGVNLIENYEEMSGSYYEKELIKHRKELYRLLECENYSGIHKRVNELYSLEMYQSKQNRVVLLFFDSLYFSFIKSYEKSNKLSMEIIRMENPRASIDNLCEKITSEYALYSVYNIARNFELMKRPNKKIDICMQLCEYIETMEIDTKENSNHFMYHWKLHQLILHNIGLLYFINDKRERAENCVDHALDFARNRHIYIHLDRISLLKGLIEYKKGNWGDGLKLLEVSEWLGHFSDDLQGYIETKEVTSICENMDAILPQMLNKGAYGW